jgi:hypothetical protein
MQATALACALPSRLGGEIQVDIASRRRVTGLGILEKLGKEPLCFLYSLLDQCCPGVLRPVNSSTTMISWIIKNEAASAMMDEGHTGGSQNYQLNHSN